MPDPIESLVSALQRDAGGIAVVYASDWDARDWLVSQVEVLLGDVPSRRVATVDDALAAHDVAALLIPRDERATVIELDGRRDQFLEPPRTAPVVLFLLRDGDGQNALAEAPGLASWILGSDTDPDALAEQDDE